MRYLNHVPDGELTPPEHKDEYCDECGDTLDLDDAADKRWRGHGKCRRCAHTFDETPISALNP